MKKNQLYMITALYTTANLFYVSCAHYVKPTVANNEALL